MHELAPSFELSPDFDMSSLIEGFDINAAFRNAADGIVSDAELELNEMVERMERIVQEASSDFYKDFVNAQELAAQMELMCSHDHALGDAIRGSETIASFLDGNKADDGHGHGHGANPSSYGGSHSGRSGKWGHKSHPSATKKHTNQHKKYSGWVALLLKYSP